MFYNIISIIVLLIIVSLGIYVIASGRKSKINSIFFLITFFSFEWLIANFAIDFSENLSSALILAKATVIGPIIIAPLYYYFSIVFSLNKKFNFKNKLFAYLPPFVALFFVPTRLNVESVWLENWGVNFKPGIFYGILSIYFIIYISLSIYNVYLGYKNNYGIKKKQNLSVLIGFSGAFIIGVFTNLLLPYLGYNKLIVYGPFVSVFILLLFTFVSIVKYELFNLKVLATQIFIFILAVILFAEIFVSKGAEEFALKICVFIAFAIFAYLLVKSVNKEAKQSRQIENLNTNLEKAAKVIKKKNIHLEKLLKMRSEFLDIASHQLHTPTTYILGMIDMIAERSGEEMPKEKLVKIKTERVSLGY